jgi:LacI family transcriptional regulator
VAAATSRSLPRTRVTPTIREVARQAGVSVTTVSRVLNGKGDVAADTTARVQQVIEVLGYESSLAARSLRSHRKQVIGLVVPNMEHSYGIEVLRAAGHAIVETGFDLIAMTTGTTDLAARERWQQQQITRLNGTVTDGAVVVVPGAQSFRTDAPLIVIDPHAGDAAHPAVAADNYGGGLAAMRYLVGLGHRRIAHVSGLDALESAVQRRRAYHDGLAEAGIPYASELVQPGDYERAGGAEAMRRLLGLDEPPTAVFAANDESALGVIDAARAAGLALPGDLSVVGFDNVPESAVASPPLTTVDQGIGEAVRRAFAMLIDLIEGKPLSQPHVTVPARLIVRASCAPPRRA